MFGAKAPACFAAFCWLILATSVVLISGCADTQIAEEAPAKVSSGDSGSALRMARSTHRAGDLLSSIQIYRTVVAAGNAPPEVIVEFGDVLLESGSPDDAIDIYSKVGAKSSSRLGALLGLTRSYLALGEPGKAFEYADEALRLAPQDVRVLVDRGVALDTLARHGEAQDSYRAALLIAPRQVSARNDLALSLALTGHYDDAVMLITPIARSLSASAKVRENMALIYALKGDTDRAAAVSRMDLDEKATQANLAFLASVRERGP